jgi:hypothetical protein
MSEVKEPIQQSIALHQFLDVQLSVFAKALCNASVVSEAMAQAIAEKDAQIAEHEKGMDALRSKVIELDTELETAKSEIIVLTALMEKE